MTAKPFCDGPFSILKGTDWIVGKDKHGDICHVLDQRGWGYLTGKGHSALGLDNVTASQMQADMQQWVVDALNAAWNRRADLAAVPAQVKVKPLVWRDEYRPVASPQTYQIWPDNGGSGAPDDPIETFDGFMLYSPTMLGLGVHQTIEAAKAAAQADYNARILAAIEPQPDPRDEIIARLVGVLAKLRDLMCEAIEDDDGNSGCGQCENDCTDCIAHAALAAAKAVKP